MLKINLSEPDEEKSTSWKTKAIFSLLGISAVAFFIYTIQYYFEDILVKLGIWTPPQGRRLFHRAEYVKEKNGNYSLLL